MTTLWYRDGTVAVTVGSKIVTGTDTLWKFAEILDQGDIFTLDGTRLFEVASIDSDTQLTLTEDFVGTTGTGLTYSIIPNYAVRPYAPIIGRQMLLINKWLIREQELTDWQSAPPSSDPANPTKVTITAWNGVKGTYLSLPQLLSMIGAAMDWNLLTNVPANITAWQSINPSTKQDYAPNLTDWSATTVASMAPRAWVDSNYVSLTGDTMTGDLVMNASSVLTQGGGYFRNYGFGGVSTDGVIVLGDTGSSLWKHGNQFEFRKGAANGQDAWQANLKQGGDILTNQGNQTVVGPINFDEAVTVSGKFWAGGEYDYSPGYQVVLADDGSVAYLDAKTRDGAFFTVMNLRGESLKFNGAEVYTTNNFTPGNYLPLVGGTLTGNLTINGGGFTVSNASAIDNSLRLRNWGGVADNGVLYFGIGQSYIFKTGNQFRFANDATTGAFTANLSRSGNILTDQGDQTLTGIFSATWLRAESAPTDTVRAEIRNGNTDIVWIQATAKSTNLPTGQLWYRAISHTWTNEVGNIIGSLNSAGLLTVNNLTTNNITISNLSGANTINGSTTMNGSLALYGNANIRGDQTFIGGRTTQNANKIRIINQNAGQTDVRIDSVTFDAQAFAPMEFRASKFTFTDSAVFMMGQATTAPTSAGTAALVLSSGNSGQQAASIMLAQSGKQRYQIGIDSDKGWRLWSYDDNGSYSSTALQVSVNALDYRRLTVDGGIKSAGTFSTFVLTQRDNANIEWHMYGTGNQWRVWNSANSQDIISAGTGGEVRVNNQLYLNAGWFRSQQAGTGWYSEPHGGGIYMTDSSWVRVYNGKGFLVPANIRIESSAPTIECYDADEGYTNWIHCNSGNHGFLQHNSFAWGCYRDSSNNWIVVGNIAAYASDARLKKNYRPLADPIGKLAKLDAIEFDWDLEFCEKVGHKPQNPTEHGVLAQQIQKVFPEWVVPAGFNRDYWTVLYDRLSVFNLAVNKAQQKVIEAQEAKIRDQEARLKDMEIRMAKLMARFNKWEAEHG